MKLSWPAIGSWVCSPNLRHLFSTSFTQIVNQVKNFCQWEKGWNTHVTHLQCYFTELMKNSGWKGCLQITQVNSLLWAVSSKWSSLWLCTVKFWASQKQRLKPALLREPVQSLIILMVKNKIIFFISNHVTTCPTTVNFRLASLAPPSLHFPLGFSSFII